MAPCDPRPLNLRLTLPPLLSLFTLLAMAGSVSAQGSISGNVITEDREPISGATISVPGTGIGSISGFRGRFRLEDLRVGQYDLVAEAPGYAAVRQTVLVEDGRMSTPVFVLPEIDEVRRPTAPVTAFRELERRPHVLVQTEAYCVQAADSLWLRSPARAATRAGPPEDRVLLVPRSDPGRILMVEDTVPHTEDPGRAAAAGCLCGTTEELSSLRPVVLRGYYVPAAGTRGFRATFDLVAHGVADGTCGA